MIVVISISLIYLLLIGSLISGFHRLSRNKLSGLKSKTRFSVIIPFRNEETHLPALLESMARLNYPKDRYEIIFVNDASEDHSLEILHSFLASLGITPTDITVTENARASRSPKKDAIALAISQAKYDWIVTTDADCILPRFWLESFDELIQKEQPNFIAAPVTYPNSTGFLQQFQQLDVLSLQGATMGGFGLKKPFLCNGANLAYKKKLFTAVNGFHGNTNIASGDDIFLMEKALSINAHKVRYLKCEEAVVFTNAQTTFASLVAQRVRWAAKSSASNNHLGKLIGLMVFLQNINIVVSLILVLIGLLPFWVMVTVIFLKLSIDYMLISASAHFFAQKIRFQPYFLSSIIHPFLTIYVVMKAHFSDYEWKGRRYKK